MGHPPCSPWVNVEYFGAYLFKRHFNIDSWGKGGFQVWIHLLLSNSVLYFFVYRKGRLMCKILVCLISKWFGRCGTRESVRGKQIVRTYVTEMFPLLFTATVHEFLPLSKLLSALYKEND